MIMISREAVLESLKELADINTQRRLWLAERGEVSSYEEAVSQLFNDTGLGHALENGLTVFSPQADALLTELRAAISSVDIS